MTETETKTAQLAAAFVARLAFEIGTAKLADVCDQNAAMRSEGNTSACASHEHCDANMTMLDAWHGLFPDVEFDPSSDAQAAIWNAAWDIAFNALASLGE